MPDNGAMQRLALLLLVATMSIPAAVKIEKTNYKGWPNSYRVSNGEIELIATGDVGPRIIRFGFVGGQNLFKEYVEQLGKTNEIDYQLRGGHRLWVAPELLRTTWALDNSPVKIELKDDGIEITGPVDSAGLQKQIVVKMSASGTEVELVHRVRNKTPWTIEFAPWALTMMAQGGTAITGFLPRGKHPEVLLPTNPLVMWAYTDLSDKRWRITKKYLSLRQDPHADNPQKIGLFNPHTWGAYLLGSELFLKQTAAEVGRTYPDFGSSFETFTSADMLEMETLGPLQKVEPAAAAEHIERWSLHKDVRVAEWSDAELDRVIGPRLK